MGHTNAKAEALGQVPIFSQSLSLKPETTRRALIKPNAIFQDSAREAFQQGTVNTGAGGLTWCKLQVFGFIGGLDVFWALQRKHLTSWYLNSTLYTLYLRPQTRTYLRILSAIAFIAKRPGAKDTSGQGFSV